MAGDIDEACVLALGIAYSLATWRELDESRLPEIVLHYRADAKRLSELLKLPEIGGKLSLANPYAVEFGGFAWESYASAVATTVLRGNPEQLPRFDSFTWMGCGKEYERATGKACNVETIKEKRRENAERDEWIIKQDEAGKSLKEIREGILKCNRDWWTLDTDQAVHQVLKRRGKR